MDEKDHFEPTTQLRLAQSAGSVLPPVLQQLFQDSRFPNRPDEGEWRAVPVVLVGPFL